MRRAPCGCESIRLGATSDDDEEAAVHANDGPIQAAAWRCPRAGHVPAADRAELPLAQQAVLRAVDGLVGAPCGATCPMSVALTKAAADVIGARAWREHGEIRTRVGRVSLALCEAVDCVDRDYAARTDWERAHPEKKAGK